MVVFVALDRKGNKMRLSVIVLACFGAFLANTAFAAEVRGVISGILSSKPGTATTSGNKPDKPDKPEKPDNPNKPIESGHEDDDDGCKRQYPLPPNNSQRIPYSFNRYGISPDLTEPPHGYLEVRHLCSIIAEAESIFELG